MKINKQRTKEDEIDSFFHLNLLQGQNPIFLIISSSPHTKKECPLWMFSILLFPHRHKDKIKDIDVVKDIDIDIIQKILTNFHKLKNNFYALINSRISKQFIIRIKRRSLTDIKEKTVKLVKFIKKL